MKGILIALGLATALTSAAQAGDLHKQRSVKDEPAPMLEPPAAVSPARPWEGPYVGVGIGYRWSSWKDAGAAAKCLFTHSDGAVAVGAPDESGECHDGNYHTENTLVDAIAPSKEDDNGFLALGRVGYDWQRQIVFGVFGEINYADASTHAFADSHLIYAVGGRIGLPLNGNLMPYVNAGIEITDYSGDVNTRVDPFVGAGLDVMLQDGWTITPELRWTFRDDSNLPAGWSNDDPLAVRLIASKKF